MACGIDRFVMFDADGAGFRSASEPVRASLVRFSSQPLPEIDNAITLLHAAPTDQLRCRHDRHDNGERATPLSVPATQWNQAKILQ